MNRVATLLLCALFVSAAGCESWRRDKSKTTTTTVVSSPVPTRLTTYEEKDNVFLTSDRGVIGFEATALNDLHHIHVMEIRVGRLAMDKAHSDQTRRFGELLWQDHKRADEQVRGVARERGIELVDSRPTVDEQKMLDRLDQLTGAEFDRIFAQEMEDAHQKAVRKMSDAHAKLSASAAKDLVGRTIPTLRAHERMAEDLQAGEVIEIETDMDMGNP